MILTRFIIISLLLISISTQYAQEKNGGWFSLGVRSTANTFSHEGFGLGTGGQFRIQLNERVNSDWFADYITINNSNGVRSEYYHIGWSILFYPFKERSFPKLVQPYIVAGHCFDYNKKTLISTPTISEDRWGSAVQAGIGTHLNLTKRFDISLTTQYMIHLTNELEALETVTTDGHNHSHKTVTEIKQHDHSGLEGHLLATISLNYKIGKLW